MITKEELKEISDLSNSVPEEFRLKCFELLLSSVLNSSVVNLMNKPPKMDGEKDSGTIINKEAVSDFKLPIPVGAFISQYKLNERNILDLFHIDGDTILPIYKINGKSMKEAEIKLSLLIALENALITGKFNFDTEILRKRCNEEKCYDAKNFKTSLNQEGKLYKFTDSTEVFLTPDGKSALADLLEELTKGNG